MLRNSLVREMNFKLNFLLWMIVESLWFVGQLVFIEVIFSNVDQIGDWTKWQMVLLVGTHQIISQIFQGFFFTNLVNLPELVRTGKLDFILLQPVDGQFATSVRQFGMDSIVNALVGVGIVTYSLHRLHVVPGAEPDHSLSGHHAPRGNDSLLDLVFPWNGKLLDHPVTGARLGLLQPYRPGSLSRRRFQGSC